MAVLRRSKVSCMAAVSRHRLVADGSENPAQPVRSHIAEAEQIEIAGGATGFRQPDLEQHGALEHKLIRVGRLGQTIEEALNRVTRQEQVEVKVKRLAPVEQALMN
jgi:hypothetical protein